MYELRTYPKRKNGTAVCPSCHYDRGYFISGRTGTIFDCLSSFKGVEMQSQKLENLLNQALNATESERERSQELNVGYNPVDQVWELIIKYSGNLETVRQISERVTELLNEYAIIHIRQSQISDLVQIVEVEYVEKPKRLFFQVRNGKPGCLVSMRYRTPVFRLRDREYLWQS